MNRFAPCIVSALMLLATSGCYTMNKGDVKATEGSPEGSEVELISIPAEPGLPKYVLVVEPFQTRGSKLIIANHQANAIPLEDQFAAQLTSALSNVGNFSLLESDGLKKIGGGRYSARLQKGEVGPFVVKGVLTEFTEEAEGSHSSRGGSLGWAGAVAGVAGAVSGNSALGWTGAGVAAANPTFNTEKTEKKGMVAFDIKIVDGKTGRIVKSFPCSGTFTAQSAVSGMSLFGIGGSEAQFAQSVIGQAMRAALNDATRKTWDSLKGRRG